MHSTEHGLAEGDLPGIYKAADTRSLAGQRSYVRWTQTRLWCVVGAAAAGAVGSLGNLPHMISKAFTSASLSFFIFALLAEITLLTTEPENSWYNGRAIAESAKTLAWKYAVGALPFPTSLGEIEASQLLRDRLHALIDGDSASISITPNNSPQISPKMRSLRRSPLSVRKQAFLLHRISDQQSWYSRKAQIAEKKSRKWRSTLLALESLGIIGTLLILLNVTTFDIEGIAAAVIAAGGAWIEVKQYDNLASAYTLTAMELNIVRENGESVDTEENWSEYVNSAEQAISREHTMWLARRGRSRARGGS